MTITLQIKCRLYKNCTLHTFTLFITLHDTWVEINYRLALLYAKISQFLIILMYKYQRLVCLVSIKLVQ